MTFMSYGKCHKMPFYGILRHLPYDINVTKYSNIGIKRTVLIRHFDIRLQKSILTQFFKQNFQKTENQIFSLYFGTNSFVKNAEAPGGV